jgi:protoheme IX farnesyltransferase
MTEQATTRPVLWRELMQLAKPRLSALVLVTTAGGYAMAPGPGGWARGLLVIAMTTAAVAAANTLNCFLERESDGRMKRTRARPLPAGAVPPAWALAQGIVLSVVSVTALSLAVNAIAGILAALAIVSYVAVYTPMKYRSPHAVIVGALPGAIPPLLGWAARTGTLGPGGLALFAVMFVWQLPHFLAIALYLKEDYGRAGIRVLPLTHGEMATKVCIVAYSALLLPVTLTLPRFGVGGTFYWVVALGLGLVFLVWSMTGFKASAGARWARGLMLASIAYLTLLFGALAVDGSRETPPLPVLGKLPGFSIVDQSGQAVGPELLAGRPTAVNFIFTTCPTICPLLTKKMATLQARSTGTALRLLSFTVDPETDTPPVLADYGRKFGADFARWRFVTGPREAIDQAVVDGFKIALIREKKAGDEPDLWDIVHGEKIVLVDGEAQIRGYYDADEAGLSRLLADAKQLE